METKRDKLESEFCVEEFRIIIKLRLKLLASRLGRTEDPPVVTGSNMTQAEDSTAPQITDCQKHRDSPGLSHSDFNIYFDILMAHFDL